MKRKVGLASVGVCLFMAVSVNVLDAAGNDCGLVPVMSSVDRMPQEIPTDYAGSDRTIRLRNLRVYSGIAAILETMYIEYVRQEWSDNQWRNDERLLVWLDEAYRTLEERLQMYVGESWQDAERFLFVYEDDHTYPVRITYQEWEGGWQTYKVEDTTLDDAGRPVEIVVEMDDDFGTVFEREVLSYNDQGKIAQTVTYYDFWGDGSWELGDRNTWMYDDYGSLIVVLGEEWDDWFDEWWEDSRILYMYDDNFNNISRTTQYYDGEWINSTQSLFSFDRQGNIIEWVRQMWTDSGWLSLGKTESQYERGCFLKYDAVYSWSANMWNRERQDLYEYDGRGLVTVKLTQVWTGTVWENAVRYVYGEPSVTEVSEDNYLPAHFELLQNYPNPFNPTTTIRFMIDRRDHVSLRVYDMLGREVATLVDEVLHAGEHVAVFNVGVNSSGTYIYRLRSGDSVAARQMVLIR